MTPAVDVFRALADPTRLAVFECILEQEKSVSDLTSRFAVSQPAISQHLSNLLACGLVSHRRDGKSVLYSANPQGMRPVIDWLNYYRSFWKTKLPKLESLLKRMGNE